MSDYDRKIASRLIQEATHDNKLDLPQLAGLIKDYALKSIQGDQYYGHFRDIGMLGTGRDAIMQEINRGVREVLGVIPEDQWHQAEKGIVNRVMARIMTPDPSPTLADYQKEHGLVIAKKPAQFNATDLEASMGKAGFVFSLDPEIAARRSQALKTEADILQKKVQSITSPDSDAGRAVSNAEKKQTELALQQFIGSKEKLGVGLGNSAAAVDSALKGLAKAGVTSDDKVLGDEISALKEMLPKQQNAPVKGNGR